MRTVNRLILILSLVLLMLSLASCKMDNEMDHHDYHDTYWSVSKEPTCTEDGEEIGECRCGVIESKTLYALGHNYVGNSCENCGSKLLEAGLYDSQGELIASWDSLVNTYGIDLSADYEGFDENRPSDVLRTKLYSGKTLVIGKDVTRIGECALYSCDSVVNIVFEEGSALKVIGSRAFANSRNLKKISLPSGIEQISNDAFSGVECEYYNEYENGLYFGNDDNPYAVLVKVNDGAYCEINGKTELIYRDAVNSDTLIKHITIGNGVTSIPDYAFYGCTSLESVILHEGITYIGESAFEGCTSLDRIKVYGSDDSSYARFPSSLKEIGRRAFIFCSRLEGVELPDGVESIGDEAFALCFGIGNVIFADNSKLTHIGESAFKQCLSLRQILIPEGVKSIGSEAFYGCRSLDWIKIPDSVTSIGTYAFAHCSLSYVEIPGSLTEIGNSVFYECTALRSVKINHGVTRIADYMFSSCYSLQEIELPDSVTSIEDYAFGGCYSLDNIYYAGTEEQWSEIDFDSSTQLIENATIHFNFVEEE